MTVDSNKPPSGTETHEVTLDAATPVDAELLSNLLELYIHDLSPAFPNIEIGENGRFGYGRLRLYWEEPDRRFPFIVRYNGRIAGFILVTRGSPVTDDPAVLDVAEFFVLRRYRRSGVGLRAAYLLWNRLPGTWVVRVSEGSPGALPFWARIIAEYSDGSAVESRRDGHPHAWRDFVFQSTSLRRTS